MAGRIKSIDIAKGIGIILVVLGHLIPTSGQTPIFLESVRSFIYQFHVPLFFFLSGLFYASDETWKCFLSKKFKRLYLPYVIANIVFLVFDILFRSISGIEIIWIDNIKHAVKIIFLLALSPMGGATWFLKSLLFCSIVYKFIASLFKNNRYLILTTAALISISGLRIPSEYSLSATLVSMVFYSSGVHFKPLLLKLKSIPLIYKLAASICLFVLLSFTAKLNSFDMAFAEYSNYFLALPMAFCGITMIVVISDILTSVPIIKRGLSYTGRHSLSVLIGHLAAFKIVILLQIILNSINICAILSHPCYDVSGFWSMAYLLAGIVLPLGVEVFYNRLAYKTKA